MDTTDTASVGFTAELPTSVTATLGFLQFNVTNNTPQTPQLSGGLTLGLNNPYGTGRLSLNDLASSSTYTLGLSADASLNLHLAATIAGNPNLPNVSADFYFDWSADPTASNPDTLGFNNVTISMGGFIDRIIGEIDTVLKPIKPLVDLLSTPLPVLSTPGRSPVHPGRPGLDAGPHQPRYGRIHQAVDDSPRRRLERAAEPEPRELHARSDPGGGPLRAGRPEPGDDRHPVDLHRQLRSPGSRSRS